MGIRIGVVCEGSNDFGVLRLLVKRMLAEHGIQLDAFDCLQPQLSASFAQEGGGGWGPVKGWCEMGNGQFYRTFIDKPLFAQSPSYDLLLIHLDGDVFDHCEAPPLRGRRSVGMAAKDIVRDLEAAIMTEWLRLRPGDQSKIVPCVPVRHLEAWLLAAYSPAATDHELRDTKADFANAVLSKYTGKVAQRYILAAVHAATKVREIEKACSSFAVFWDRLKQAALVVS